MNEEDEQFHLFWGGPFSQWNKVDMEIDGVVYNCCEQYMMAMKAKVFGDKEAEEEIMETHDPREQKAIGRRVQDFDRDVWENIEENGQPYCWNVVYKGNKAKFDQNPGLKEYLLATKGTTIVEASPYDKIWGIGRDQDDPAAHDRTKWRGTNWLGEVLTVLRDNYLDERMNMTEVVGHH